MSFNLQKGECLRNVATSYSDGKSSRRDVYILLTDPDNYMQTRKVLKLYIHQ